MEDTLKGTFPSNVDINKILPVRKAVQSSKPLMIDFCSVDIEVSNLYLFILFLCIYLYWKCKSDLQRKREKDL